jgi:uncharacterized membrane protein YozB (DUF420 family)
MVAATIKASAGFLVSYLTYHLVVVEFGHTRFNRPGPSRASARDAHLARGAAGANLPLVIITLVHAARAHRHVRLARWPIWLTSVTGVLVYLCLYWWNPPAELH